MKLDCFFFLIIEIKMILKLKSLEFERFVLLVERNEIFHLMDDLSQV